MKKNNGLIIALIIILSILCLLLAGILGVFLIRDTGSSIKTLIGRGTYELAAEKEYENTFTAIRIETNAGNIEVENSTDGKLHLAVYCDKNKLAIKDENGTLAVKAMANNHVRIGIGNNKSAKITLSLPADFSGTLDLESDYGDFTLAALPDTAVNIESDYGNIKIEEAKNITAECDYGDIRIGTVSNRVSLAADCGNIEIGTANLGENSDIQCDLGNINIGSTNDIYIDAETDLGNTKIAKNNPQSDITLKIQADCGNVTIG